MTALMGSDGKIIPDVRTTGAPRLIVYTAITAGYDRLQPVPAMDGVEYRCYHDGLTVPVDGWRMIRMNTTHLPSKPVLRARWYKINSHALEFPCPSIWMDQSLAFTMPPGHAVSNLQGFASRTLDSVSMFQHPLNVRSAYEEIRLCRLCEVLTAAESDEMLRQLMGVGHESQRVHFATGVIYRKNNDPRVDQLERDWWDWMGILGCHRDQISLPVAFEMNPKLHISIMEDGGDIWDNNFCKLARSRESHHPSPDEAAAHRNEAREYWATRG